MEILELRLLTKNIIETERFYRDTMGLKKEHQTEKSLCLNIGSSKLIFELIDTEQTPKYHFAFNIPINKIDEAINWTSKRTNLIEVGDKNFVADFENWNAKAIYFYDNNHNILEFISRVDLNNFDNRKFSIDTILNINEVGIVTEEPLKIAREIIKKTNTNFFPKGPKREDFVVVGSDNGLFVISNPKRNWYPTQQKGEKQPVKAKIRVAENIFELQFN
jgi:catechol-2,3-dioxygenase